MFNKKKKISERRYLEHKLYAKYYWPFTVLVGIMFIFGSVITLIAIINGNADINVRLKLLIVPIGLFACGIGAIIYAIYNKVSFKKIEEKYLEQQEGLEDFDE